MIPEPRSPGSHLVGRPQASLARTPTANRSGDDPDAADSDLDHLEVFLA